MVLQYAQRANETVGKMELPLRISTSLHLGLVIGIEDPSKNFFKVLGSSLFSTSVI